MLVYLKKTRVLLPPAASALNISRPTFQKLEELEHDNLHLRLLVNTGEPKKMAGLWNVGIHDVPMGCFLVYLDLPSV